MEYCIASQKMLDFSTTHCLTIATDTFIFPMRLDALLGKCFEEMGISREKLKRYIKEGAVYCNAVLCANPSKKISAEDILLFTLPEESTSVIPEEGIVDVLYEDESILLINKASNTVVHPCTSSPTGTLLQHLLYHYPDLGAMGGERPAVVHRLDKDTTGLLLIARTEQSRQALVEAFSKREVEKYYLAFVHGSIPEKGTINTRIGRDINAKTKMAVSAKGKEAHTSYTRIYTTSSNAPIQASLVLVRIHTGRTHQIRVHLSSIGFPIIGDPLYNMKLSKTYTERPLLHAYSLTCSHPSTGEAFSYTLSPPKDFFDFFTTCQMPSHKVVITGSAGSGKSTVLNYFREKGIPCWSADAVVAELYKEGNALWYYMRQSYGNRFINEENQINTAALLDAMEQSSAFSKEMERIIHGFLVKDIHEFWSVNRFSSYIVAEVPLYYESCFVEECTADTVLCVCADTKIRVARLEQELWSKEKIEYVLEKQLDDTYKREHASYCIENIATKEELYNKIAEAEKYIVLACEKQKQKSVDYLENIIQNITLE